MIVVGLLLALLSAAAINLGFLLQHRGLREMPADVRGARERARVVLHSRSWLGGQALGWAGFATQILAVSIAPLSLVQSFAAGGLALSVPLAAGLFGYRISRRQLSAVLLVAFALAILPIGLPRVVDHIHTWALVYSSSAAIVIAGLLLLVRKSATRAAAAGLLYGVADAAIKAVSVGWRGEGSSALFSAWTVLAVLATFGGFLAFQAALHEGDAIAAISLMTALAALVALGAGVVGFGESLGSTPGIVFGRLVSIGVVLGCVPILAGAQTEIGEAADRGRPRLRSAVGLAAATSRPARNRAAGGNQ